MPTEFLGMHDFRLDVGPAPAVRISGTVERQRSCPFVKKAKNKFHGHGTRKSARNQDFLKEPRGRVRDIDGDSCRCRRIASGITVMAVSK